MKPNMIYSWEMETLDGTVMSQYTKEGKEQTWKVLDVDKIVRVSFLPAINLLPRHDIFINVAKGDRFIRRFGKGFIKSGPPSGFDLKIFMNVVVTNRCRYCVISNGRSICTHRDHDIFL